MNGESIHHLSRTATTLLLDSTVRGTIVLLAVGAMVWVMHRASAAAWHRLWLVAILASGVMPLLVLMPGWRVLPAKMLHAEAANGEQIDQPFERTAPVVVHEVQRLPSPIRRASPPVAARRLTMPMVVDILGAGWLIGAAVMGGRLLLSRLALARLARYASPASNELQSMMRSAAAQLRLNRGEAWSLSRARRASLESGCGSALPMLLRTI